MTVSVGCFEIFLVADVKYSVNTELSSSTKVLLTSLYLLARKSLTHFDTVDACLRFFILENKPIFDYESIGHFSF